MRASLTRTIVRVSSLLLIALLAGHARGADVSRVLEAAEATARLDVLRAHELLDPLEGAEIELILERGRLALYDGDYDSAVALLAQAEPARTDAGAELLAIARACARATAGTITVADRESGINVRLQDDADRALVPYMIRVAIAARDALHRDLHVDLPRPLHIELVRDLFTLAAMTGLPESAAHTTGTVAVAKWGRITMISPRAVPRGYPWADTLAHELAHLAQTRASADRAPLWLQEGVAKRQETRWRQTRRFDDFPASDVVAAMGLDKGLGRPIDKLGASIAMLPTPEQALVAFAEVSSFVKFWVQAAGDEALPAFLTRLGAARNDKDVSAAMQQVSGASLAEWNKRWLAHLATVRRELPPGVSLDGDVPHEQELRRGIALGELLRARGHHPAASKVLGPTQRLAPFDPLLRYRLAKTLAALGQQEQADKLVARLEDVHSELGPWMALHARTLAPRDPGASADAARVGVELTPLDPEVACHDKLPPNLPESAEDAALCQAARAMLLQD